MVRMWSLVIFFIGVVILLPSSYEARLSKHVAKNCRDLQCRVNNGTGIYLIKPEFTRRPFLVYCDMDTEGGGWTVFLNRADDRQSFALPWKNYKYGFGNDSSFWLGLEYLYQLTTDEPNELLIESTDFDEEEYYVKYDRFGIGSEGEGYRLKLLDGYNGNLTDALSYSSGQKFSTIDRNNEVNQYHDACADLTGGGGWWYNECTHVVFTGDYVKNPEHLENAHYMRWVVEVDKDGNNEKYKFMKAAKMMVRPKKKCEKNLQEDDTDKKNEKDNTDKRNEKDDTDKRNEKNDTDKKKRRYRQKNEKDDTDKKNEKDDTDKRNEKDGTYKKNKKDDTHKKNEKDDTDKRNEKDDTDKKNEKEDTDKRNEKDDTDKKNEKDDTDKKNEKDDTDKKNEKDDTDKENEKDDTDKKKRRYRQKNEKDDTDKKNEKDDTDKRNEKDGTDKKNEKDDTDKKNEKDDTDKKNKKDHTDKKNEKDDTDKKNDKDATVKGNPEKQHPRKDITAKPKKVRLRLHGISKDKVLKKPQFY